jgi:hypothetical protein
VLEAGWLATQQHARPAVVAALVDSNEVGGDPTGWAALVSKLDAIKASAKLGGIRVVIVVTQAAGSGPIPDDRASMVCRHAGIDRKYVWVLHSIVA